ncbi:MAG: proton-conducting transporter membrane subunit [Sumerlaeia bacterium]
MLLLLTLLLPFLAAASFLVMDRRTPSPLPRLIALFATGGSLAMLAVLTVIGAESGSPVSVFAEWMPELGLNFSLWLDGPALFFAWLVLGIGFLVFFYAGHYMDPEDAPWRFYGNMLLFMGAMLGVVISRNIVLMLLFWEMTSLTSFLLIGHWSFKKEAIKGAVRALLVTVTGGLCLLTGIGALVWIGRDLGLGAAALEWDGFWANKDVILAHPAAKAVLILMLLGAFTKSAQFPFHFWLPGAMEAPTPVSAYLHAATMVKAGIYLLGRMYPVFEGWELWLWIVAPVGLATMLVGGFMAVVAKDLKQLLAYSTVSQLGLLTSYYGFGYHAVGSEHPLPMDLLLIASHALFKGGLFMMVGILDHGLHTRDWTRMGGLRRTMPWTAALTIAGCYSMAGGPLTLGFVHKKLWEKGAYYAHAEHFEIFGVPGFLILAAVVSLFTVAYCLRMIVSPFFGEPRDKSIHPHEGSFGILLAPAILIGLSVAGGLFVPLLSGPIGAMVNEAYYSTKTGYTIAFYQLNDVDIKTWLSLFVLFVGGPLVFVASGAIDKAYQGLKSPTPFTRGYELIYDEALPAISAFTARVVQRPSLQRNATITLMVVVALAGAPLLIWRSLERPDWGALAEVPAFAYGAILLIVFGAGLVIKARSFLPRLLGASVAGLSVALVFVLYKAPDLALTQVLVELAILVMFLLLLKRLPNAFDEPRRPLGIATTAAVAVGGGLLVAALTYAGATSTAKNDPVLAGNPTHREFYLLNSKYPETKELFGNHGGGGTNVVNVILVDFRGLDTMGEAAVLAIAGLGVLALLTIGRDRVPRAVRKGKVLPKLSPHKPVPGLAAADDPFLKGFRLRERSPFIMRTMAPTVAFFLLGLAVVLFFSGHNKPGGGFIAGLLTAAAMIPFYLVVPRGDTERLRPRNAFPLLPLGILFAVGTPMAPMFLGHGFFRSGYVYVDLPLIGETEFASAALFDLGIYLIVVGTVLVILKSFGRGKE